MSKFDDYDEKRNELEQNKDTFYRRQDEASDTIMIVSTFLFENFPSAILMAVFFFTNALMDGKAGNSVRLAGFMRMFFAFAPFAMLCKKFHHDFKSQYPGTQIPKP